MRPDDVLVDSCLPEECHYMKGNLSVRQKLMALKPLLEAIGISGERLKLEWKSLAEDMKLAERAESFTQTVKQPGRNSFSRRRC